MPDPDDHHARRFDRRRFLALTAAAVAAVIAEACASRLPRPLPSLLESPAGSSPIISSPTPSAAATPAASTPGPPPTRARRPSPIRAENRRAGDPSWDRRAARSGPVAGYLGRPSAGPDERLDLRVSAPGSVSVEWYRLGWYGGAGGRLLRTDQRVDAGPEAKSAPNAGTGLVEAGWPVRLSVDVDPAWPSGMYLAVIRSGDSVANAPIVIRPSDDAPPEDRAPVLFVSAQATWQAYSAWGGASLYAYPTQGDHPDRAYLVSFDRPYLLDRGAGQLRRWELQFIRWMEREGRDVEYAADVDLELHPGLLDGRRSIVFAGHPEYWSRPMRERIEAAIAAGTHVVFLTANEVFWQIRLEDGPTGSGGRIVCYKSATLDPFASSQPSLTTCRWRESPVDEPEAELVGQMYSHVVRRPADWIVERPDHWWYEGTGLMRGDRLTALVGQEFDTVRPGISPADVEVLARGPVDIRGVRAAGEASQPTDHTATTYVAASGAVVVAAGTFQWSWAIDDYGDRTYAGVRTPLDRRVARMTANLFDRLGDGVLIP